MPSESLEAIFRRDLDRVPGLSDEEWIPSGGRVARRLGLGDAIAVAGVFLVAVVVVVSVQAERDADVSRSTAPESASPYFVVGSGGASATTSPGAGATPSPAATWIVGPATSSGLSGAPTCAAGESPILDITFSAPPGDQPGTGAATAEAAFRRTFPAVTDFTMYPFAPNAPAVWIVAGGDTYIANYIGGPGQNSWFAHAAKFVGCYTPQRHTAPPSGDPSARPTTFGENVRGAGVV